MTERATDTQTVLFLDVEAGIFQGNPIDVAWGTPGFTAESSLIRPAPGWRDWDEEAEAVHEITLEMLAGERISGREVASA